MHRYVEKEGEKENKRVGGKMSTKPIPNIHCKI